MHKQDLNRVQFYSKEDMAGGIQLSKGEKILRKDINAEITDINDVLEFYHINKYFEHELFLKVWTESDIHNFKKKSIEFDRLIKNFFSKIDDGNINQYYEETLDGYIDSFWEIINNLNCYKKISKTTFKNILVNEPFLIHSILKFKGLVSYYDKEIRNFLLDNNQSAEILLSIYEVKDDFRKKQKYLPKSLSVNDKEQIIIKYLDQENFHLNYLGIIENAKNRSDFKLSDRTRLKAKRLHVSETEKIFKENQGIKYGVSVSFPRKAKKIKDGKIDDDNLVHYSYSADFILKDNNPYFLFQYFDILFEYVDEQKRIELVSKRNEINVMERIMGIRSENEYFRGTAFTLSEMTSQAQIFGYSKILNEMNTSIEEILQFMFIKAVQEKYNFPQNASFSIPNSANSFLEKVRIIAPEFESILKQYKLFVEDGIIDFELLQMSSTPTKIKDIPSLNNDKYIYFNEKNIEMVNCANIFFSDQTILTYVDPFKEKRFKCFFDLLSNEELRFENYEEHQKSQLNYLIDKGFIKIDENGLIEILNYERLFIFKDLYDNEFGSFYHYTRRFQEEVVKMKNENIVYTESTLFAKTEQAYFNYYLNKSEFTNGLDLRNSYLHGTQGNPTEIEKHEFSYLLYLKLIALTIFKIEDDLQIYNFKEKSKRTNG